MGVISHKSSQFKPEKLDLYDKKILLYLFHNLRTPFSHIAKELHISPQRVKYKFDNFIKKGVISPNLFLNYPLLGIPSYMIFVKQMDEGIAEQMISDAEVFFCFQLVGTYRYAINVVTFDFESFIDKYLKDIVFDYYLIDKSIPNVFNPFSLDIGLEPFIKKNKPYSLGKKDYRLLAELSRKPDASIVDLANKTGFDRKTIKIVLERLLNANFIQSIRYSVNLFALGFQTYLFFYIKFPNNIKEELISTIINNDFTGFMFLGHNVISFDFFSNSFIELRDFINDLEKLGALDINLFFHTDLFYVEMVPEKVIEYFEKKSY